MSTCCTFERTGDTVVVRIHEIVDGRVSGTATCLMFGTEQAVEFGTKLVAAAEGPDSLAALDVPGGLPGGAQ